MKKTRILWLSKANSTHAGYELWEKEPFERDGCWWFEDENGSDRDALDCFCSSIWARICPFLKLRKGTCVKVKMATLKHGFKLERVK